MKKLTLLLGALLLLAACTENLETPDANVSLQDAPAPVLYATIAEGAATSGTKVYLDENYKVLWHADDRISAFMQNTYNQQYRFTGNTGDNAGSFSLVPNDDLITSNPLDNIYAVYPYSESTTISNAGVLSVTLPAAQTYSAESFGPGANTMVAVASDLNLQFKNACGYLMFKFYGDGVNVKTVTLKGNNHEKLAGPGTISMNLGGTPSVTMSSNATEEIVLTCTDAVTIGTTSQNYTEFWFAMPPLTFTNGFTVTVTDNAGGTFSKSTSSSLEIVRSYAKKMAPMAVQMQVPTSGTENGYEWVDLGLTSGLKWATCNVGANAPEEYGDYFAWGEIEPYYTEGHSQDDPCNAWKDGKAAGYIWASYQWCNGSNTTLTKYNTRSYYGTVDNKTILELGDDAAWANWGGTWRMPTYSEWIELIAECTWTWTTQNGVNGGLIVGPNGNSIFLPAACYRLYSYIEKNVIRCYYWSSSLYTDGSDSAGLAGIYSRGVFGGQNPRYMGQSVRPVTDEGVRVSVNDISLNQNSIKLMKGGPAACLTATVTPSNATQPAVIWSSSNTSVATVDYEGYVRAVGGGSATITATTYDGGKTATCSVSVSDPGGYEYVDLGLTSGLKWATCNVGADAPEEFGDYFAWGEVEPYYTDGHSQDSPCSDWRDNKTGYNWASYKFELGTGTSGPFSKYVTNDSYGTVDNNTVLDPEDDAASANWGYSWRMPTDAEWTELMNECTWTWTTQNEVNGYLVTGPNGHSLFIPANGYRYNTTLNGTGSNGYYWSSSLHTSSSYYAYFVRFYSGNVRSSNYSRFNGLSVRPVFE